MRSKDDIIQLLNDTFADQRLSRGETGALKQVLKSASANERALWRHCSFYLGQEWVKQHDPSTVIEWLESMSKLLDEPDAASANDVRCYFSPQDDCVKAITNLLGRSLKQVDLCVFTVTDDRLTEAIISTCQRGVQVRLMTDDDKSFDLGSDIVKLARGGVEVYTDTSDYHMHHKFAVFDRRTLLTGSYNWTRSASTKNEENIVVLEDEQLAQKFTAEFERLLADHGTRQL